MDKTIDQAYVEQLKEQFDAKPEMPHRFYRVYHMRDGRQVTMHGSPHDTYEDAVKLLWYFHPSQIQGVDDMAEVAHVTIEQRFIPRGYFKD